MLSEISKKRLKYLGHANRNTKTDLMTTVLQVLIQAWISIDNHLSLVTMVVFD
jgi:hypothetical protein